MSFWNVTREVWKGLGRNFESKFAIMFGNRKLWSKVVNMERFFCKQVLMQIYGRTSLQSQRSTGAHESRILVLCSTVYLTFTAPRRCLHECTYLCAQSRVSLGLSKRTKLSLTGLTDTALQSAGPKIELMDQLYSFTHVQSFYLQAL